ncbi:MAG: alginate lyase family protein, partial [Candidatus Ornithomonoglobus sp.]
YEYLRYIDDPKSYPEGKQYGEKLLFLMRAFAEKKEYGFNRTLETGERLSRWVDIIDELLDTPAMTPDIFCNLISFVRGDCEFINSLDIENDTYWWSNWRIVANAGFFKGTEYFPEFNTYREFREKAEENIKYCMALLYNADMSFKEAGPAYALWCAELFCDCAEMAEMNGHPMCAELKEKLKYAARFAMESFYPDGYDTNIGDSNYINKLGSFKRLADFLDDDALTAYASGGREGSPGYLSSFYSDVNSAFMRNSWDPSETVYVSFLNNPYDGHAHPDSNQVLMYAYGKPLLVDSGRYSYSSYNDIYNRLRTAAAHNTIEVVGMPLAPHSAAAKPFTYHISNKVFEFNTSVQTGYEGITHTRNVLFMYDGYAIVTDYVEGAENQQYRQNWHFMPSADAKADGGRVQTAFNGKANITIVSTGAKSEILDGYHSANYGLAARSSYASYLKTGKAVKLDTVLYPQRAGEEPTELEAAELESGVDQSAVRLSGALNGIYYVRNTSSSDGSFADGTDSYSTDAKLFYAEGGRIILAHGKSVIKNGKILLESPRAIPDISIVIKDGVMNIYGDSITAAENPEDAVKIKADGIRRVHINGNAAELLTVGRYIVSAEVIEKFAVKK